MLPFDPTDRRTRLIALVGLLAFGLAAGIELAARLRGGSRILKPGSERGRARAFFPPRAQPGATPIGLEELLGLLARYRDDPTAQQLAEAFMTEPDLAGAWREVERDGDVSAFVDRVRRSPALPRLKANAAAGKLAALLGSDPTAATLVQAFGVEATKPAPEPLQAAGGPSAPLAPAGRRMSSGGPILSPPPKPATTPPAAAPAAKAPAKPPSQPAPPKAAAKEAASAPVAERKPAEAPAAEREGAGSPPETRPKPDTPEPCPMAAVCAETTRAACSPRNAPASFSDVRRQGCGCAIEDLTELMRAPGNGELLAALGGKGGFTPLLERTDWVMRTNAQATGRCWGFRGLGGPDRRREAGRREGELWRSELRRQLRLFAEREGVPFEEPAP